MKVLLAIIWTRHWIRQQEVWQIAISKQGYKIESIEAKVIAQSPNVLAIIEQRQRQLQDCLLQMVNHADSTLLNAWYQAGGPDTIFVKDQQTPLSISQWASQSLTAQEMVSLQWVSMDIEQVYAPQAGKANQWSVRHIVWKGVNLQPDNPQWYQERSEKFETFSSPPISQPDFKVQQIRIDFKH